MSSSTNSKTNISKDSEVKVNLNLNEQSTPTTSEKLRSLKPEYMSHRWYQETPEGRAALRDVDSVMMMD
jgi:hypothetical protein